MGLNGKQLLDKTHTDEIKQRLRLQTETAIQAGVFGVPSFVVDGEIFWGNDRLHFLKAYLQGKLPTDKAKVEEILARPRAADRHRIFSSQQESARYRGISRSRKIRMQLGGTANLLDPFPNKLRRMH